MGKLSSYSKPFMRVEHFTPHEYISGCTQSSHGSADGKFVYGWVLKCESVTYNGVTYGHGHNNCPEDSYYEKQTGGTVDGTFIRAQNQTEAQDFSLAAVDTSLYPTTQWIDYDGNGNLSPSDWWIIGAHAFKVQGSQGVVSYPVSAKYDVNHS